MDNKEKCNSNYFKDNIYFQGKLQEIYDREARKVVEDHNEKNQGKRLIYNGTYVRTLYVWNEKEEEYQTISIIVTRLRESGTNKSFTYQGSILASHSKYLKPQMMELMAHFMMERENFSIEAGSNSRFLPVSVFRRWLSAFTSFLQTVLMQQSGLSVRDVCRECFAHFGSMEEYISFYQQRDILPGQGLFAPKSGRWR